MNTTNAALAKELWDGGVIIPAGTRINVTRIHTDLTDLTIIDDDGYAIFKGSLPREYVIMDSLPKLLKIVQVKVSLVEAKLQHEQNS